jgi:hypothetical protein
MMDCPLIAPTTVRRHSESLLAGFGRPARSTRSPANSRAETRVGLARSACTPSLALSAIAWAQAFEMMLATGQADAVAFGRPFVANSDLPSLRHPVTRVEKFLPQQNIQMYYYDQLGVGNSEPQSMTNPAGRTMRRETTVGFFEAVL